MGNAVPAAFLVGLKGGVTNECSYVLKVIVDIIGVLIMIKQMILEILYASKGVTSHYKMTGLFLIT